MFYMKDNFHRAVLFSVVLISPPVSCTLKGLRGPLVKSADSYTLDLSSLWFQSRSGQMREAQFCNGRSDGFFSGNSGVRLTLINDRHEKSEIFLKGP